MAFKLGFVIILAILAVGLYDIALIRGRGAMFRRSNKWGANPLFPAHLIVLSRLRIDVLIHPAE
jgi:hypothetical protein